MDRQAVSARQDIRTKGGLLLAKALMKGVVTRNKPTRKCHRGQVPVIWEGKKRVFWTPPELLRARVDLAEFITPPIVVTKPVELPDAGEISDFDFGSNLRMFRAANKLSQQELAKKMADQGADVSQTAVSNWEHRKDAPSGSFLEAAGKVLNVPQFAFFLKLDCDTTTRCLEYLGKLQEIVCSKED